MKDKYFQGENEKLEPRKSLFAATDGSMRSIGHLFAASIFHNGPTPNFLAEWVYEYIVAGVEGAVKYLPQILDQDGNEFAEMYNRVIVFLFYFILLTIDLMQNIC